MAVSMTSSVLAQESFNVYGNRFQNFVDYGVAQFGADKLVFGVMEPLGVTCMNFTEGDLWNIRFFLREDMQEKAIYGTGGTVENDSVFLVLGRMGTANTTVIKASSSGEVLWANWYNTGTDERPDKIVRLQNGDYLVSVRTNISYYEFGEWGSRSGVMRIDSRGRLKWFRILDQRSLNTYSLVLGMHETKSGELILTQAYNAKLGLITLSADGDSVRSLRSVPDVNPTHSAYDAQRGILYLVNANRRLIQFDSSSKWLSTTRIDASSLQSFNQVYLMNDSSLVLGGKYQNTAAMLNCDLEGKVRSAYSRNSDLLGIFPEENGYVSLIRQGYMVSRHTNGVAPGCFSAISATVFSTASESAIAMESHVPITGSAVYGGWGSVYTKKDQSLILKSTNCLRKDLAARPDKDSFNQTCPQFSPRLYLTNHGTTNVSSGMLDLKLNGAVYSNARVDLPSALGPKGSVFINLPQMQLVEGWNTIEGNFYQVDGESDGFTANNSFKISVRTRTGFKPRLNGPDSVCPGETIRFVVSGGGGETIFWYRDRTQLEKQGSQNSFETGRAGTYHAVVSDSGCLYFSDTLQLSLLPAPNKPIITYNAQTG
ncbi:MAG: hypothetical protein H6606_05885 [Flavobacteriales bacterium]|nr:hypothetical protein [Flavobacteriales bacterium]